MPTAIKPPTQAELTDALGPSAALWPDIVATVSEVTAPITVEWKPSKLEFGRVGMLQHKKRTLLYLIPEAGAICVAIVLGERAYGLAMASALPAAIKQIFAEAKPYAEGRGIRLPVRSAKGLPVIKLLMQIKTTPNEARRIGRFRRAQPEMECQGRTPNDLRCPVRPRTHGRLRPAAVLFPTCTYRHGIHRLMKLLTEPWGTTVE